MKFLLVAINAKYIHSNLGVYSLRAYVQAKLKELQGGSPPGGSGDGDPGEHILQGNGPQSGSPENGGLKERGPQDGSPENGGLQGDGPQGGARPGWEIEIGEYTINHRMGDVLQDIYRRSPDVVGFSCYIWNILYVLEIIRDLKKVLPHVKIWLGGPEVSFDAGAVLRREPQADLILIGEGEETFFRLAECCLPGEAGVKPAREALRRIPGLALRGPDGELILTGPAPLLDLSKIPFPYRELDGFENRIIYYESSRGCPFSCSYCLSSIDRTVRFRSLDLVKRELEFFLEKRVPQVKFVDRTFNCSRTHALEVWRFLKEHDNGVTNFHFEISADLLDEEELQLLGVMRPGLIQLEIGVQTTNPGTIRAIRRKMDLGKVKAAVGRVNGFHNIHQHLDLIAGLPGEDYESFGRSFNEVYAMEPEQLQLGFLKVLKGSHMEETADLWGIRYRSTPPYEVLSTNCLSFGEIIRLKGVEEMVEVYYNSGQFRNTMRELKREFPSPFEMYGALADYYLREKLAGVSHSRLARYEILFAFIRENTGLISPDLYRDLLMYDLYLRENVKSRPSFAGDQSACREAVRQFFISEEKDPVYLKGYEGYDSRQMSKMAHVEAMSDGTLILFDYRNRDALFHNARAVRLPARPFTSVPDKTER